MNPIPPSRAEHVRYRTPRGTCASCGSGEVTHIIIGMPSDDDLVDGHPEWVHLAGCIPPGFDRECMACGTRWSVD